MAYSQQSFTSTQVLTSSQVNQIEENIRTTREVMGETRTISGSTYDISSGQSLPYFGTQIYIDSSGEEYYYEYTTGLYGFKGGEISSRGHSLFNIYASIALKPSLVTSHTFNMYFRNNAFAKVLDSGTFLVSSNGVLTDPFYVSFSSSMVYMDGAPISKPDPMLFFFVTNNASLQMVNSGLYKSVVSIEYLDRNY